MSKEQPDNQSVQDAWVANARWWDDYVGAEGNEFHRTLVAPAQLRLLALQPGERVVEFACGNGHFAREMDRLLDKIAQSGIGSLTSAERSRLEKARQELLKREGR